MEYVLKCTKCGRTEGESRFRCGSCGAILEVSYDYPRKLLFSKARGRGISKYSKFLPIHSKLFYLGEGDTELKKVPTKIRGCTLLLKVETENPTHTFKDRSIQHSSNLSIALNDV